MCHFPKKIGIYPFVTQEPAKRNSVNRAAGTLETKAMTSVKRDTIRTYLTQKMLRDIREKWPRENIDKPIIIQQDNAKTHVDPKDVEFCQAAQHDGFDIGLMYQPPNSPDMNVLDLGIFRALQSLRYKRVSRTINYLISYILNFTTVHGGDYESERVQRLPTATYISTRKLWRDKDNYQFKFQIRCDAMLVNEVRCLLM